MIWLWIALYLFVGSFWAGGLTEMGSRNNLDCPTNTDILQFAFFWPVYLACAIGGITAGALLDSRKEKK